MLRLMAGLGRIRRRSYRFAQEQAAIAEWLEAMESALPRAPEFAEALAELPRVLKGYSDTLMRGKAAYARIMAGVVRPALASGQMTDAAPTLRRAIAAALADDSHTKLDEALGAEPAIPNLRSA
jgi:indolepyruvate ferredoxin oxidoreductase beta subunit